MDISFSLAEILNQYVRRSGYSLSQLAQQSGIPRGTLLHWMKGRVQKPQQWSGLVRVARALHLSEAETTLLLNAAGHPAVETLMAQADEAERRLLSAWIENEGRHKQAPFQAIMDVPYFVGRQQELRAIGAVLLSTEKGIICSLQGIAGVGKTALVARLAHQLRPHFPDGVLWGEVSTADTMDILGEFARAYHKDVGGYTDLGSRSQVVRGLLAHKQALMVLDGVQRSEQVNLLLPPTGLCAVLITTRCHNLFVTQGADRFSVEAFDPSGHEALALFGKILGQERVQREREVFTAVAEAVGGLPQAMVAAARRLSQEPGWSAADLLERLH